MNPENLTTTLLTSSRLKELGVKQESFFKYCDFHYPLGRNDDDISGRTHCLVAEESRIMKVFGENGEFHWNEGSIHAMNYTDWEHSRCELMDDICSAFTAEEIGELLPDRFYFDFHGCTYELGISKAGLFYSVVYENDDRIDLLEIRNKSLTEALALTYIQLKEKGIL